MSGVPPVARSRPHTGHIQTHSLSILTIAPRSGHSSYRLDSLAEEREAQSSGSPEASRLEVAHSGVSL